MATPSDPTASKSKLKYVICPVERASPFMVSRMNRYMTERTKRYATTNEAKLIQLKSKIRGHILRGRRMNVVTLSWIRKRSAQGEPLPNMSMARGSRKSVIKCKVVCVME